MKLYAAILAGGVGTRLWPRSRQAHPKQFSDITGSGRTMIQATADRLAGLIGDDCIYVVTGDRYAQLAQEQLPQMPTANVLIEPEGRNTGPAVGLACIYLRQRDPDAIIVVLPADHVIPDAARFQAAIGRAATAACQGYLVTLGIEPTFPHTGYGYIQSRHLLHEGGPADLPIYEVVSFHEKPNLARAESFLADGGYYWNGGIFVSQVARLLAEMELQMPRVYANLQQIADALKVGDAQAQIAAAWSSMPSISIDYGVMEQAERVAMVPLRAGWNDIGSWDALETVLMPDANGNLVAKSDVVMVDSYNNIVYCEDKLVAMVGVDDLVVVDAGDALLIGHRKQMQKVKEIVDQLRANGRSSLT